MYVMVCGILASILLGQVQGQNVKPFPGQESQWMGFKRHDFEVGGSRAIVVEPKEAKAGRPWAWRGEFFGAFPNADIELLKQGWHLAYVGVPDQFGSPRAMKAWETFYRALTEEYGLNSRPALIGLSRGALYCLAWGAAHPDRCLLIYLDNGVCDYRSWPGGRLKRLGTGDGSAPEWAKLLKAYNFKDDSAAIDSPRNPINGLPKIAQSRVPLLLVYADADPVVPHKENSELVFERYTELGGPVERIVKPGLGHHPHGLTDPKPIVDYFERIRGESR